jgi:TetR/AcrR family transcriptional regulator, transcriptional repressor of aconitase
VPKVTDAHRESRREQILVAAWKCFARKGFHGTSMADVIAEADLSAGAVYLYFKSKEDIIVAVATQVFAGVQGRLTELLTQDPPPSPTEIAGFLTEQPIRANQEAPGDLFALLLSVWGEATRNPTITDIAKRILAGLRGQLAAALERWSKAAGQELPVPAADLAPIIISLVQGMVVQHALSSSPPPGAYRASVEKLFTAAGLGPPSRTPAPDAKPQRRLRVVRSE